MGEGFNELVLYKEKNGNCDVPQSHGTLGNWANTQCTFFKKGKLAQECTTQLKGIGFNWGKPWEEIFNKMSAYKVKNGNCNVPRKQGALGKWVTRQHRIHRKGKLAQDRVTQLEGIGFNWGTQKKCQDKPWEERSNKLTAYKEKNNTCNVP